MAKRFTDTEKFTDPWFRRLSTKNKLLWDWLLCSCDHAGIISLDLEFVEMVLGESYPEDIIESHFSDRVLRIGEFKYFIPKFIRFQYGDLNPDSRVHRSVIKRLSEHGINFQSIDTLSIPFGYPLDTPKDKDKEKDKDKDKDCFSSEENFDPRKFLDAKKILPEETPLNFRNSKGPEKLTPDHVVDLWNTRMGAKYGRAVGLGSGKHLENCLESLKYLPDEKSWENLFAKCEESAFLRGERTGWTVTLTWIVNYDNALRVLSDEFNDLKHLTELFSKIKPEATA